MMKHRFIRCVAAAFLALALGAGAGLAEEGRTLPDGVAAHFSFANPTQFLQDALMYADAATKGTPNHVPGEMLAMLAMLYSPLPFDAFAAQRELHIILPGDYKDADIVVVLSIDSYETLLEGMAERDWRIGDPVESAAPLAGLRHVALPDGTEMILADLGDGRAVLALDEDAALRVVGNPDWTPEHDSDAAFAARTRIDVGVGERLGTISEEIVKRIAGETEDIVRDVSDAGLTEAAGRWLAEKTAEWMRALGDELEQAREAVGRLP